MKKLLVISSTPRNGGNSDVLCDQFSAGAKNAGHLIEKIRLKDFKINFCTGCGICNKTHKCVQKDDMELILPKLIEADVIVLATPVYFFSMCGQLKVMIDRVCPRYTEVANKKFYLIATAAEDSTTTFDGTVAGYQGFLDCLPGAIDSGRLLAGGAWQIGDIQALPIMNQAFELGNNI